MKAFVILVTAVMLLSVAFAQYDDGPRGRGRGSDDILDNSASDSPDDSDGRLGSSGDDTRNAMIRTRMMSQDKMRSSYKEKYRDDDCNSPTTVRERALCQLSNSDDSQKLANVIPEECRKLESNDDKRACVQKQKQLSPCHELSNSDDKTDCAKRAIGLKVQPGMRLGNSIRDMVADCRSSTTNAASDCVSGVQTRVNQMLKFRIDSLEVKVKDLAQKGYLTQDEAADFIAALNTAKEKYAASPDVAGKTAVLQELKNTLSALMQKARANYQAAKTGAAS